MFSGAFSTGICHIKVLMSVNEEFANSLLHTCTFRKRSSYGKYLAYTFPEVVLNFFGCSQNFLVGSQKFFLLKFCSEVEKFPGAAICENLCHLS